MNSAVQSDAPPCAPAGRAQGTQERPATIPLSFAQERLWFLDQLEPDSPLYNIPTVARVKGELDGGALEQSIAAILARHEALRTRFVGLDGIPTQIIDEPDGFRLAQFDLASGPEAERERAAMDLAAREVRRPFNLSTDRLLRGTLARLGPRDHLLILVVHHIVSDEWSLQLFFRELAAFYEEFTGGRSASLPPLPMQYPDFALWQREWLQGEIYARQLKFWEKQLSSSPITELPSDHPRRAAPSFSGHVLSRPLAPGFAAELKQLARAHRATLFMVLLAAFKALLHRYTQAEDILVGSPIAGRNRLETEELIGFFVNTLALRTRLGAGLPFEELLHRVRETTLGAYAHQDLPFERLVAELRPERSLSHNPFARVMFAVQSNTAETFRLPGLELQFIEVETGTAKFDASFVIQENREGLAARVEYNSDLFEAGTIKRLLEHFEVLLQGIVEDPKQSVSTLPLLTENERRQMLVEWNRTATEYPRDKCIHQLFEDQAERTPQAAAVVFGAKSLTYRELNARANQLAHYLRQLEIGPDVPVAICVERSIEMVVGCLAVLKAGGAYVPLDGTYPKERLSFMLADTNAPLLLTQQHLAPHLPRSRPKVLCLDAEWEIVAQESRLNLSNATTPEQLAYIMYTSGSTGEPRGVAVPHRAVNRLVLNTNYIQFKASDRIAQVSNFSFDAATFEIWGALLNGAQLIGISRDAVLSPREFARELREKRITVTFLTAALFNQIASEAPGAFESLRTVIAGGEALDPKWVRAVLNDRPPRRLLNGYGPTENTTFTCCYEVAALTEAATNVPIGRPLANTQVYILDAHFQPVPIGVPGQLCTAGDGLARGYWNRPDLTAQKFIPNPFAAARVSADPAPRLYQTGDLVRYLPDGNIEFLGRLDQQVKLRGFRIELGEVESHLSQHPDVQACVVAVLGQSTQDKRLAAYFVASNRRCPNESELRRFLDQKLPDYMVPSTFVLLEALPLTANGKVDRSALPDPGQVRPCLEETYAAPHDRVEAELTGIWEQVLGVQPVGVEDGFFDLGGHSLLAVRVVAEIEKVFGKKLRVATIFQAPTIQRLAAIIREDSTESSAIEGTSIVELQAPGAGAGSPLFLVHGAGGGMFWGYANLTRHLPGQPVYGFKSRGLDGREELESVEEMAAQYLADLRKIQARGPYHLGGYCFGGIVAYEMARQLRARGELVALLALLNCSPPNSGYTRIPWTLTWGAHFLGNLLYWAKCALSWTTIQRREFFNWKWNRLKHRLEPWRHPSPAEQWRAEIDDLVDLSSFSPEQRRLWEAHIRALVKFHPQPYPGRVHLFRSPGHPLWCSFDADYGWGELAKGGVTTVMVPGAHEKILEEPCVKVVAAELERHLRQDAESHSAEQESRPQNSDKSRRGKEESEPSAQLEGEDFPDAGEASRRLSGGAGVVPSPEPVLGVPSKRTEVAEAPRSGEGLLSFSQQRLWFLNQLEPAHPVYNLAMAINLGGPLVHQALEGALNEILRRHSVLRTVFPAENGKPVPRVLPAAALRLHHLDLASVAAAQQEASLLEIARQERERPFQLATELLLRANLIALAPERHVLLLVWHELIADSRSSQIILQELPAFYTSLQAGEPAAVPSLPPQYAQFAERQREQSQDGIWTDHLAYWRKQLDGAPAMLELPADRPRPAVQSYAAGSHLKVLPGTLSAKIKALSHRLFTDVASVVLSVLAVLLKRYTRRDDILIGTPACARKAEGFSDSIGNFSNLLVLRLSLAGDPPFRELVEQVRRVSSAAAVHARLPFEKLVAELHPAPDRSYHPLVQILFAEEGQAAPALQPQTRPDQQSVLSFEPMALLPQATKFDLSLHLQESAQELAVRIDYASDLFDAQTVGRLLQHLQRLLEGAVEEPERPLSQLPMLTPDEQHLVLVRWNDTSKEFPRNKTLIDLFEEQVARTPQAEALVCGSLRLTYHELHARASSLAEHLRTLGVGNETLVGICLRRSWELIVAILGTLKAGGAYVPLDPAYPKDRLAFMLDDAKVRVLLTQEALVQALPKTAAKILCVEQVNWEGSLPRTGETRYEPVSAPRTADPAHDSSALAYVIYTSGSTGQPKGVALEHRGAVALACWARDVFTADELSGVLASTSICFDLSVFEMFVPLCWGGRIILADNALALPALAAASEVTLVNTVPSAIRELLRVKGLPSGVRVVNLAGEPLPTSLVDQIYRESDVHKVYDLYGPTETTTYSTFTLRQAGAAASIGKPLANEQVFLLDEHRLPVPIGGPGEIFIAGDGLARGYLNRPELTAQKFVAHPLRPGARAYRTGDLARWRPDGNLEFLGRLDHQVKIRGFRIELGEIESVLKKHPGVREVVVVARDDQPGGLRLVAYLTADPQRSPSPEELRHTAREKLPEHMVPSVFVVLGQLPLTPNGKVDRKALPAPERDRSGTAARWLAPRTPVEVQLAAIWREVLQMPEVGVEDSFFDVGGHSLLAIQVISRIREVFGVELPLVGLFDAPTIAALAAGLSAGRWNRSPAPVMALESASREEPLPASFVQERLWFLEQLEPGTPAYQVPAALRLKGKLDLQALQHALDEIVRRHEALRTTFTFNSADGSLTQNIVPELRVELKVTNVSSTDDGERLEGGDNAAPGAEACQQGEAADLRAQALVSAEAQRPFDLARGPLLRAGLVRLDDTNHTLWVVMHHTVADGWSLGIFFRELGALYNAFALRQPQPQLPVLKVQLPDFAAWQRRWMSGRALDAELAYWKETLEGAPAALELPVDRTEAGEPSRKGSHRRLQFPSQLAGELNALSRREGATPFMVLMAALAITLHKWTNQADLVIGTVVAGRNRREIENVIGCFMNFLPIRTKVLPQESAQRLLARVRQTVLEAQAHQECPFEKMVEAINPERKLNQNPLYNVALLLQNFPDDKFQAQGLEATPLPVTMEAALLDLRFEAEHFADNLAVQCEYKTDLFNDSTIMQLLESLGQSLETLVRAPQTPVADFKLAGVLEAQAGVGRTRNVSQTIAIAGTFTVEPLEDPLRYWLKELDSSASIQFAPYNQIFQQLLDPASVLAKNQSGLNVLLLRLEDWQRSSAPTPSADSAASRQNLERNVAEFLVAMKAVAARRTAPFLVCFCPPSSPTAADPSRAALFVEMEKSLEMELERLPGVYVLSASQLAKWYPVGDYYDPSGEELGHVPYTPVFFTALATALARKFHVLQRTAPKVIVLDCDQTLWSGVCGEDGPKGIRLAPGYQALQAFMRAQHAAGRLLCLCSKNNEDDVNEVFKQRPEMPLQREHFAACRLNWRPKSENLRSLAEELRLGLDSFVFIDDNPLECAEVEAHCPEALTLQLPEDPERIAAFLDHCWVFDHLKLTAEDRQRSEMYRLDRRREQWRSESMSLADFLAGLELRIQIEPMSAAQLPRVAQLTQRTNQFNFTTRRRTEKELRQLLAHQEVLTVSVRDRFGDYGLVGVVIHQAKDEGLEVDSFLLSCRVLGRGVEHRMLSRLGELARQRRLPWVDVYFSKTARNKPALDFLENVCGAFKQGLDGALLFRLPAGFAAEVSFTPQDNEAASTPPTNPERALAQTVSAPTQKFARCRAIALEASNAAQIHQSMEAKSILRSGTRNGYVAPRTRLERQLCELWQKLMRIERVGVRDNFFELGGHSLLAVRLFAQIEKITGRKFPLVTLFQAPTIAQLARVLCGSDGAAAHSILVPIQAKGSRPPLFLVHGAGGDVLWGYANLAAHLPADQPLYGIKSRGQIGQEEFTRLEDMAAYYLQELRAFQPEGPYYLGGYCFGGNVAYEMARQLHTQGQRVALLVLLDSAPANAGYESIPWWQPAFAARFTRNLFYWGQDFLHWRAPERRRFVARKARALGRKLARLFHPQAGPRPVNVEEVIDPIYFPANELKLWEIHLRALLDHVQQPYPGSIILFRTSGEPVFCSFAEDFCWGKLAQGGAHVRRIPGSHESIFMEPNVQALAAALNASLVEARAASAIQ
ncbi:putative Phenylalanine racemase (ATP-hydrolyzing) [Verrucomicrobia bacterium]|nr:putative Phenylalanine racemase (ATP-hydrolyzing) [Verrucomicrobiota bacterium]